ncbi:MAG: (Na+)-NQR maturation NqrM [Pirellulales bacterium]|nr:(Na+)-NQR maturation NqrM [Pirellulales bacterium]MBX3433393.1 (Na+)-NQR maturation NqrM [Pirellulales bacterium]
MWLTILITVGVFILALTGMAIGVILSDRRIKGSCGGMANLRDEHGRPMCEGCTNPSPDCTGSPDERVAAGCDEEKS